jgi:hypothetical protein
MSGRICATLPNSGANAGDPNQGTATDLHCFQPAGVDKFIDFGAPDPQDTGGVIDGCADGFHRLSLSMRAAGNERRRIGATIAEVQRVVEMVESDFLLH